MAFVLANRVLETSTTTGTGTITLAGAVSTYQSFSSGIGNANTTYYVIAHQSASEWEMGIGTYTSSGSTLSRDTVITSSNSGSLVNFSAGTKNVYCDSPASRTVFQDNNGYIITTLPSSTAGVIEMPYYNSFPIGTTSIFLPVGGDTLSFFNYVRVASNTLYSFEAQYPSWFQGGAGVSSTTLSSTWDGTATYDVCYTGLNGRSIGVATEQYALSAGVAFASASKTAFVSTQGTSGTGNTAMGFFIRGTVRVTSGGWVRHGFVLTAATGANVGTVYPNAGYFRMSPLGPVSGSADLNIGGWA